MVLTCCVLNCTQRHEKGVSFHTFPKDKTMLKKWLTAIRRADWQPNKFSFICHNHFTPEDYATSGWSSLKRLKKDAVPSVFNFPDEKIPSRVKRKKIFEPESATKISCEPELPDRLVAVGSTADVLGVTPGHPEDSLPQYIVLEGSAVSDLDPPAKEKRKKRNYYVGDFASEGNVALEKAKEVIKRKNAQLKVERKKVERLQKRIAVLEDLVRHLDDKY